MSSCGFIAMSSMSTAITLPLPSLVPRPPQKKGGLESLLYLSCSAASIAAVVNYRLWYASDVIVHRIRNQLL